MDELPKSYVEEELAGSQKRSKVAIALLVLVLLMLPVGVYATLRSNNDVRSNASNGAPDITAETSMRLASPQDSVNNQSVFPVDILIRSDQESANFFSSRLNFPSDKLEVLSIATSAVDLNDQTKEYIAGQWIDASFNNQQGIINLAAGSATGIKTNDQPTQKKYVLATIFFKTRSPGDADITLQPGSMILKSEDNSNILTIAKSLKIQIKDAIGDFANKSYESQAAIFNKPEVATNEASLFLQTPNGGEVFSFYKPISIKWQTSTLSEPKSKNSKPAPTIPGTVIISLLLNDQYLGQLTEQPSNTNEYLWDPTKTLPLDYVKSENSFKIELQSVINGRKQKIQSAGPFSILTGSITARQLTQAELGPDRTDLTNDGSIDFKDVSHLLNQYYKPVTVTNKKSDINNDLEINDIDLWFLRQALHL